MEYEVRFYFNNAKLEEIINMLNYQTELINKPRTYEKTMQFNHCDKKYDFYSDEVDGRFRLRISSNDLDTECKISWKSRLKDTTDSKVNKEEEKEIRINSSDIKNLEYIINNVMHFTLVESYERYRTVFENNEVEIAVDEYPFGVCLEIEAKCEEEKAEEIVKKWVNKIGLDIKSAYRLSWDDKYLELCNEQGVEIFHEVTFDKLMPTIDG